jgi:hypothetical protein
MSHPSGSPTDDSLDVAGFAGIVVYVVGAGLALWVAFLFLRGGLP